MSSVFNSTGHDRLLPQIVSARGIRLTAGDGRHYVDFTSGVWSTSLGHRHDRIDEAMQAQAGALAHAGFCYSHPIVEEAAEALLSICGFADGSAVFLSSGSEAIEYARQVARVITGRSHAVVFHDAYLGAYSSALERRTGWSVLDWEKCESCPGGRRRDTCDHFDIPADVSEFLFEPGSSSGRVRFAPAPFVRRVADLVRDRGGKVIANEVTTGIGRTGTWFGYNHYGVEPDLVVTGKGIGNGYPVSAIAMTGDTTDELSSTGFTYMQSHQNDPLGAAVVKEVIAAVREGDLIERAAANGRVLVDTLRQLLRHDEVVDVRGRGLMLAIEMADEATGRWVFEELLERGYVVCPRGPILRIDPPLITPRDELLSFAAAVDDIVAQPKRARG